MGQKVHPVGLRLGITKSCDSQWIPDETHHYPQLIKEDEWIRSLIKKRFPKAKISKIYITRQEYKTEIKIAAAYPKYVIKSELHTSLLKKDLYYICIVQIALEIELYREKIISPCPVSRGAMRYFVKKKKKS